ncbi:MAG: hypothetical protein [Microvirus sp.]|nr:MAG: hypothetical protein [Microvirus sp.]
MSKRNKMSRSGSRKNFTKHAKRVNGKNSMNPMRGGIRL